MKYSIIYILIVVIVIVIAVVLIFGEKLNIEMGAILAFVTGGFAAFKGRFFKKSPSVADQINQVEEELF